ncbi:hypothetical protein IC617_01805 [Neiella sp. HB171785]|uniref:Uncharacterized protein n=1 Tax=Neiella litorisoli TaxID=2771431 RepID=A0A8J6UDM6_9GAMM|nr:hypothetical protein [Neiella litorisoli]MBD1388154.1 hypothetical protein [Neiella litorisoli]
MKILLISLVLVSVISFLLGLTQIKKLKFLVVAPFMFVYLLGKYFTVIYDPDPAHGAPMIGVLFVTLATPIAFAFWIFFALGYKHKDRMNNRMDSESK